MVVGVKNETDVAWIKKRILEMPCWVHGETEHCRVHKGQ